MHPIARPARSGYEAPKNVEDMLSYILGVAHSKTAKSGFLLHGRSICVGAVDGEDGVNRKRIVGRGGRFF